MAIEFKSRIIYESRCATVAQAFKPEALGPVISRWWLHHSSAFAD